MNLLFLAPRLPLPPDTGAKIKAQILFYPMVLMRGRASAIYYYELKLTLK